MRVLESTILFFIVLYLLTMLWGRKRPLPLTALPALTAIVTVAHWLTEGYRWQMLPAYVLTALLLLLMAWPAARRRWPRGGWGVLLGVWLLALLLPLLLPVPRMPSLTGPHRVGTATAYLVDGTRDELWSDDNGPRELMVQLWYPADTEAWETAADAAGDALYIESLDVAGPVLGEQFGLPAALFDHINLTELSIMKDVPLAADGPFPVLLFAHGLSGLRMQNTVMMRELASHGYVVAALGHTYANAITVFPDGRTVIYNPARIFTNGRTNPAEGNVLVRQWADDIAFLLDTLAVWDEEAVMWNGRLDLSSVGVFGHSTGGGATLEFCASDARCKAGIGLDSWVLPVTAAVPEAGLAQPFLFLGTPVWLGPDNAARGRTIYEALQSDGYLLTLANTGHFDFTDLPLLTPLTPQLGLSGTIDSRTSLTIQNEYVLAFFDRYLKGEERPLLQRPSPYPELTIEKNTP